MLIVNSTQFQQKEAQCHLILEDLVSYSDKYSISHDHIMCQINYNQYVHDLMSISMS